MKRERPGWERIRVQADSGAIDVGPKEIAFAAANGRGIKNYGEKKVVGYTDDGEGASLRIQRADAKNVARLTR